MFQREPPIRLTVKGLSSALVYVSSDRVGRPLMSLMPKISESGNVAWTEIFRSDLVLDSGFLGYVARRSMSVMGGRENVSGRKMAYTCC